MMTPPPPCPDEPPAPNYLIYLSDTLYVTESEVEITAIRSRGPGGQNVNKVATGVHLRFDIAKSSLPEPVKQRLLSRKDSRITDSGEILIKSMETRSLTKNKEEAIQRLKEMLEEAQKTPKKRKPTRPSRGAKASRLADKTRRGQIKSNRKTPDID